VVEQEPAAKFIDELIARLEGIKAQREALEKAEKETAALLAEKLNQQRQRLQKLAVQPRRARGATVCQLPTPSDQLLKLYSP
jgi:hypothetical protein